MLFGSASVEDQQLGLAHLAPNTRQLAHMIHAVYYGIVEPSAVTHERMVQQACAQIVRFDCTFACQCRVHHFLGDLACRVKVSSCVLTVTGESMMPPLNSFRFGVAAQAVALSSTGHEPSTGAITIP